MTACRTTRRRSPGVALACALAVIPGRAPAQMPVPVPADPEVGRTLGVAFPDIALRAPGWREKLDLVERMGATIVRVDFNWAWTEPELGRYDWSVYDAFAAELTRRGMRPLFILDGPNRLHGRALPRLGDDVLAPPQAPDEVAAFARWAAAAAVRFRAAAPIWEIWNEPDGARSWPPRPEPGAYLRLARATCSAIRRSVPDAFVTGPTVAEMPTVWDGTKPLVEAVLRDGALMGCLSAFSLHTHRFGQAPETVSRDYAVFNTVRSALGARVLPILDTEWGDSVYRGGLSEARQATWLTRMLLVNLMEGVALTSWYCLIDTGDGDGEIEDRFGLVTRSGRLRPAYRAFQTAARELRGYALRRVIARFDPDTAQGTTVLLFCDGRQACKLAAWTTEERAPPVTVPGWVLAGPVVGHLGQTLPLAAQVEGATVLAPSQDAQFAPVRPRRGGAD